MARRVLIGMACSVVVGVLAGMLWPRARFTDSSHRKVAVDGQVAKIISERPDHGRGARRGIVVETTGTVKIPGAPGYSATRLARVEHIRLDDIYTREPRNEAFAAQREQDLADSIRDAIDALEMTDGFRDVQVECHTATCKVTVVADRDKGEALYNDLGLFPFADDVFPQEKVDPDDPSGALVTLYLAYPPNHLDRDAFLSWYRDLLTKEGLTRELGMAGVSTVDNARSEGE